MMKIDFKTPDKTCKKLFSIEKKTVLLMNLSNIVSIHNIIKNYSNGRINHEKACDPGGCSANWF
jgi:hypothetical protein